MTFCKSHILLAVIIVFSLSLPQPTHAQGLSFSKLSDIGHNLSGIKDAVVKSLPALPTLPVLPALSEKKAVAATVSAGDTLSNWIVTLRTKLTESINALPKIQTFPSVPASDNVVAPETPTANFSQPTSVENTSRPTIERTTSQPVLTSLVVATPSLNSRLSGLENQLSSIRELVGRQSDSNSRSFTHIITETVHGDSASISALSGSFSGALSAGALGWGSATSTGGNGVDITTGCFSINGVCIGNGGGGSSSMTFAYPFTKQANGDNSTSTLIGLYGGFFSNASSTVNSSLLVAGSTTLQAFTSRDHLALGSTTLQNFSSKDYLSLGSTTLQTVYANSATATNLYATNLLAFGSSTFFSLFASSATGTNLYATNLLANGSTTLQKFTASEGTITSATSTNFLTANLLATGSSTFLKLFASSATSTNLFATNFLATASSTFQALFSTSATGTNLYSVNFLANGSSSLQNFTGIAYTALGSTTLQNFTSKDHLATGSTTLQNFNSKDFLSLGSTTLQNFTFQNATGSQSTTTNLYAVSANFGNVLTDVVNFKAGIFNYLSRSTTTLQVNDNAWVIATNTAAAAYPLMSFNNSAGTSTIQFFGATTTGLTAGVGMGIPTGQFVLIGDGKTPSGLNILKGGLCVDNDGWCTASTTGRISSVSSYLGGADIAEMYQASEHVEPGDVVSIINDINIAKATLGDKNKMMGVVSTNPGIVLGTGPGGEGRVGDVPIALAGRVPVKVSTENGAIHAGDYLTLSSVSGVGAKATKAGSAIGQALESYSGSGVGKIMVFVKNSYYSGLSLDNFPGLTLAGASQAEAILAALQSGAQNSSIASSDLTADRMLAAVEIVTPKITTGLLSAQTIESPTITALSNLIMTKTSDLQTQLNAQNVALASLSDRVTALENASSSNMSLAGVAEAFNSIVATTREWVMDKVTAALGIFTRLEVGTVKVSNGIEMVDPSDNQLYCMTVGASGWVKTLGACGSTPAPSAPQTPPQGEDEPVIEPESESEPTPEVEPAPEPEPTPEPEPSI